MAARSPPRSLSPSIPSRGSRRLPIYTQLAALPGLPSPFPPSSIPPFIPTLIPIRIDVDIGGIRVIDSFSIDPHDSSLTPEQWARQLCVDLELPAPQEFERRIAHSIRKQLVTYAHDVALLSPIYTSTSSSPSSSPSHPPASQVQPPEPVRGHLCPILLNVRGPGGLTYKEIIEWDVFDPLNSPELLAMHTVADLGLPPSFEPAIALSVREQVLNFRFMLRTGRPPSVLAEAEILTWGMDNTTPLLRSLPPSLPPSVVKSEEEVGVAVYEGGLDERVRFAADFLRLAQPRRQEQQQQQRLYAAVGMGGGEGRDGGRGQAHSLQLQQQHQQHQSTVSQAHARGREGGKEGGGTAQQQFDEYWKGLTLEQQQQYTAWYYSSREGGGGKGGGEEEEEEEEEEHGRHCAEGETVEEETEKKRGGRRRRDRRKEGGGGGKSPPIRCGEKEKEASEYARLRQT
ncbi:swi snf-related matrix-associated actin-dependent regulator of [Nannochloropsis oceanica]